MMTLLDLANLAHNLSNALQVALARIDMAVAQPDRSERTEHLIKCRRAITSSATIGRDLLVALRAAHGAPMICDLNLVVTEFIESFGVGNGIRIEAQTWPAPVRVVIGESYLQQALMNAVINARDAMPGGGAITLGVFLEEDGRLAVLRVSDTGIGIDPITLLRVWDPWFTTKGDRGTGLGMPFIRSVAERHHGMARIRSTVGLGTDVDIVFPVAVTGEGDPDAR